MTRFVNQHSQAVMAYLSLGSNLGDRQSYLERAMALLIEGDQPILTNIQCSPVYESPALLKEGAPEDWNQPFLNMVIAGQTQRSPQDILARITEIESILERERQGVWSPRTIDIDILLCGDVCIDTDMLTIPHPEMHKRYFVVRPLCDLEPTLIMPDGSAAAGQSIQALADALELGASLTLYDGSRS